MSFKEFLKDKLIVVVLLIFGVATIEILMIPFNYGYFMRLYIPIIIFVLLFIGFVVEFFKKKSFYDNVLYMLDELEEKFLVNEIIAFPDFLEGKIFKECLDQIDKSMIDNVNKFKFMQDDYKDYIELWIHEIKIPIATSKMIIENNKSMVTKSIDEELDKVESFIEQALFYTRSNTVEKDYFIRNCNLRDVVNECVKKNRNVFIQEGVSLVLHDLDVCVSTDCKWVVFILSQLLQNCVKYGKKVCNLEIELFSKLGKECVVLCVKDNGIGIAEGEVSRVFDKGFTGTNGRLSGKKSTGLGLFLCKKLCDKLGICIELSSVQNEGTEVRLVFPYGSFVGLF